ncbi:MAG TPA: zinc ribbon domain-containing protein [Bacteroidales bacterium]|nr:zinc ribbon domain-containing protein [Bacteroidales bacterium]
MILCSNCHQSLNENAKFCTNCGTKIVVSEKTLNDESVLKCSCGAELKQGAKFCTSCGKKFNIAEEKLKDDNSDHCSCGAEMKPGAKFCTVCGKKVAVAENTAPIMNPDVCPCGAALKPGVKFCTTCGKSTFVVQQPIHQPASVRTQPKQPVQQAFYQSQPIKPRKKKRVFLKVAAAVLIVAVIGGGGYLAYTKLFGGIRKKLLVEQTIAVSDKDQTVKYEDEIAVTVPYGLIDKEQTLSIYSVKGLPVEDGIKQLGAYDVSMSETNEFDGYMEVTIKYDPADLPAGADPSKDLFCMYLDESSNEWKGLPYTINASDNTMTIYTNHFTTFATWAVSEKVVPDPMMTVKKVQFPGGSFMSTEEVATTMEEFAANSPKSDGAVRAGWDKVNEWFGISAQVGSFAENALEMGALKGINEVATEVGLGFALVQCAIDVAEGKTGKATLELSKNLYNYWALKLINTSAINLAFVGVFVIDWSLNKFIQEAISGRTDIYQKAYDLYYKEKREKEKINSVYWYKTLKKTMRSVKNPAQASEEVMKVIHDYVWEFWQDESVVGEYQDRIMKNTGATGGGFLSEQLKKDISDEHYASIIQMLNKTNIFDRIVKEIRLDMQGKLYDKLCFIQKEMNKVSKINVVVKIDPECDEYSDVEVGGLAVQFNVASDVHKKLWTGTTDKDGEFIFNCTTLGYLDAGSPQEVIVTVKGPAGKDEEFSGELKLAGEGKTTEVEIMIGAPKLEGTWKLDATITKMTMDASLQYMDGMADFYGSGDEYRKERKNVEEQMKGQKAQLPDLKLDGIEYLMDVKREGQYYIIQSKNFNDNTALGSVQYKIKFTSRNTFEGTYLGLNHLNGKENRTEMDLKGTRLK